MARFRISAARIRVPPRSARPAAGAVLLVALGLALTGLSAPPQQTSLPKYEPTDQVEALERLVAEYAPLDPNDLVSLSSLLASVCDRTSWCAARVEQLQVASGPEQSRALASAALARLKAGSLSAAYADCDGWKKLVQAAKVMLAVTLKSSLRLGPDRAWEPANGDPNHPLNIWPGTQIRLEPVASRDGCQFEWKSDTSQARTAVLELTPSKSADYQLTLTCDEDTASLALPVRLAWDLEDPAALASVLTPLLDQLKQKRPMGALDPNHAAEAFRLIGRGVDERLVFGWSGSGRVLLVTRLPAWYTWRQYALDLDKDVLLLLNRCYELRNPAAPYDWDPNQLAEGTRQIALGLLVRALGVPAGLVRPESISQPATPAKSPTPATWSALVRVMAQQHLWLWQALAARLAQDAQEPNLETDLAPKIAWDNLKLEGDAALGRCFARLSPAARDPSSVAARDLLRDPNPQLADPNTFLQLAQRAKHAGLGAGHVVTLSNLGKALPERGLFLEFVDVSSDPRAPRLKGLAVWKRPGATEPNSQFCDDSSAAIRVAQEQAGAGKNLRILLALDGPPDPTWEDLRAQFQQYCQAC